MISDDARRKAFAEVLSLLDREAQRAEEGGLKIEAALIEILRAKVKALEAPFGRYQSGAGRP